MIIALWACAKVIFKAAACKETALLSSGCCVERATGSYDGVLVIRGGQGVAETP